MGMAEAAQRDRILVEWRETDDTASSRFAVASRAQERCIARTGGAPARRGRKPGGRVAAVVRSRRHARCTEQVGRGLGGGGGAACDRHIVPVVRCAFGGAAVAGRACNQNDIRWDYGNGNGNGHSSWRDYVN